MVMRLGTWLLNLLLGDVVVVAIVREGLGIHRDDDLAATANEPWGSIVDPSSVCRSVMLVATNRLAPLVTEDRVTGVGDVLEPNLVISDGCDRHSPASPDPL